MRAEHHIDTPRDVYKVAQWKYEIDPSEAWWRRAYFRYIYLPFLNFSFGRMGVPAVKEVAVESDDSGNVRRVFSWYEDEGIFESEDAARAGCLGERWGYTKLPLGRLMPSESAQYSGTIFPRKKNPTKWAKPVLSLVINDRKQIERERQCLQECLTELNRVLDRR